jgi:hypothetical protein
VGRQNRLRRLSPATRGSGALGYHLRVPAAETAAAIENGGALTIYEFVAMLAGGVEPAPTGDTSSKLAEGVYKIGDREYRVNGHEPGGTDYILKVEEDGAIRLYPQQRP